MRKFLLIVAQVKHEVLDEVLGRISKLRRDKNASRSKNYAGDTVKTELALTNGSVLTSRLLLLNGSRLGDGTLWNGSDSEISYSQLLNQYVSSDNSDIIVSSAWYNYINPLTATFVPFVETIINQ